MKKYFLILLLAIAFNAHSQPAQNPATLVETGKTFLKQGDYDNAILVFNKALELQPNDLEISKNILFANYLKRDFAAALAVGKPIIEREDADVQSFQMLGLVYKEIAEDKEAEKLYKRGLKKFPKEGIMYSEYGELLVAKQPDLAIKLWEQGIQADPNNSNNYFFAAKQYAQTGDMVWSILYGEMFLNMESFTPRSTEIKNLLLDQYKSYYTLHTGPVAKRNLPFTEAVEELLNKQQSIASSGLNPETLIMIRARFILDWYNQFGDAYPFKLFEHQRQLLQEGLFEAYNFWLFGPAANVRTYQTWQEYHQDMLNSFLGFIRAKVFKVPEGQNYRNM